MILQVTFNKSVFFVDSITFVLNEKIFLDRLKMIWIYYLKIATKIAKMKSIPLYTHGIDSADYKNS